jgi:hypothetical protein
MMERILRGFSFRLLFPVLEIVASILLPTMLSSIVKRDETAMRAGYAHSIEAER